jgi:hypothetical protein
MSSLLRSSTLLLAALAASMLAQGCVSASSTSDSTADDSAQASTIVPGAEVPLCSATSEDGPCAEQVDTWIDGSRTFTNPGYKKDGIIYEIAHRYPDTVCNRFGMGPSARDEVANNSSKARVEFEVDETDGQVSATFLPSPLEADFAFHFLRCFRHPDASPPSPASPDYGTLHCANSDSEWVVESPKAIAVTDLDGSPPKSPALPIAAISSYGWNVGLGVCKLWGFSDYVSLTTGATQLVSYTVINSAGDIIASYTDSDESVSPLSSVTCKGNTLGARFCNSPAK